MTQVSGREVKIRDTSWLSSGSQFRERDRHKEVIKAHVLTMVLVIPREAQKRDP